MSNNIGKPHDRIDGRLKVTGAARYAADFAVPNPLYAHLVISTVGKGRITGIDDEAARAVPGVREIYTHANQPDLKAAGFFGAGKGQAQQGWRPLAGPDVKFYGEIVGMVVAETLLAARQAAAELRFDYEAEDPAAVFGAEGVEPAALPERTIPRGMRIRRCRRPRPPSPGPTRPRPTPTTPWSCSPPPPIGRGRTSPSTSPASG